MLRAIAAVVAGFVLWSVLWLAVGVGIRAVWPDAIAEDNSVSDTTVLLVHVAGSIVCSLASGALAALIARRRAWQAVAWLAGILLAVGLMVEIAGWSLLPVWYHIVFLALLVPATLVGGAITAPRTRATPPA